MRTSDTGNVEQLPSGRWRARVRSNGKRVSVGVFDTEEEAQRTAAASVAVLHDAHAETGEGETLRTFGEAWLDRRELSGKHRAIHNERSQWRTHIATWKLYDRPLKLLTRRDIKSWVEWMESKRAARVMRAREGARRAEGNHRLSHGTVRQVLVLLRLALQAAVDDDVIATNPAREVRVTAKHAQTHEPWTFLSAAEIEQVMCCPLISLGARTVFITAIFAGLRQGELWGLHWGDVHLEDPHPHIVVRFSHGGPTKSGRIRHVPLLAVARDALAKWKASRPSTPPDDALVFPSVTGERRQKGDDAKWADHHVPGLTRKQPGWKSLAGITRRVRFHDLRHTCASHLVMGTWGTKWSTEEVRAMLGHADIRMTLRYAHLSPHHLHAVAAETPGPNTANGDVGQRPTHLTHGVKVLQEVSLESPGISVARPRRLELLTLRSVVSEGATRIHGDIPPRGSFVGQARALLARIASNEPPLERDLDALADAVLTDELVALALAVKAGGPHKTRRAIELAAHILDLHAQAPRHVR